MSSCTYNAAAVSMLKYWLASGSVGQLGSKPELWLHVQAEPGDDVFSMASKIAKLCQEVADQDRLLGGYQVGLAYLPLLAHTDAVCWSRSAQAKAMPGFMSLFLPLKVTFSTSNLS